MSIDPNQLAQMQQQKQLAQQYQGPQVNPNSQLQQAVEQSILGVIQLLNQTTQDANLNKDVQAKTVLSLAQAIKTLREADIEGSLQFEKARLVMDQQKHQQQMALSQQQHEQTLAQKTQDHQLSLAMKERELQANTVMKQQEMGMKQVENQQKLSHQHDMNQIKATQAKSKPTNPTS